VREFRDRDAGWHRHVGEELGLVQVHAREVQLQEFRQVLGQAGDLDIGAHVRYHAALGLDARGDAFALEVDRQPDADLLALHDTLQVDVHHDILGRMHLHILDDRFLRGVADLQTHDRGIEALIADHGEQVLLIEYQGLGVLVGAVQDGGDLARVTQAAARTFALHPAQVRAERE